MFTVCPKCTLTLVVTTVDLRAGQGYVRCGRCANVFNALIALREGDPGSTAAKTEPKPSVEPALGAGVAMDPDPEPEPDPEPFVEEITLATDESVIEEESLEFDPAATDVSDIFISPSDGDHDTGSGSYEAVVLSEEPPAEEEPTLEPEAFVEPPAHTDTIAADDWSLLDDPPPDEDPAPEPSATHLEPADEPAPEMTTPADPPWVDEMFAEAQAEAERLRTAERRPAPRAGQSLQTDSSAGSTSDAALGALLNPGPRARPSWMYVSGVAVLALLLVGQLVHYNRRSLVLSPTLGPALAKVYGWAGVSLVPRWDLTAYTVKQLGAEAEGGEGTRLRVRLSLQNGSERVQPMPLLRLTLQDRYGNAVATRDLEPAEYLPQRMADQRLLEPDQRIDAELHVIDPGKAAIGFEIDACLRADSGSIGCANDARRRTAG